MDYKVGNIQSLHGILQGTIKLNKHDCMYSMIFMKLTRYLCCIMIYFVSAYEKVTVNMCSFTLILIKNLMCFLHGDKRLTTLMH